MNVSTRCQKILDILAANGEVSVQQLADDFKVTTMTVRRDLEYLEQRNLLVRTHGGAVSNKATVVEFEFLERSRTRTAEKRAIGQAAAALVKPGMSIMMDTGTTTLEVAKALATIPDLRVVTCSLPVAAVLHACENITVILLGGMVRRTSPDLSGPLTEDNLKQFRTNLAIVGADAMTPEGLYAADLGVARISQGMIRAAETSVVVADSTKLQCSAFVKYADWAGITHVITDSGASPEQLAWLRELAQDLQVVEV